MYLESGWMHSGFVELVFKLVGQQKSNWVGEILLGLFWAWLATALIQMVDEWILYPYFLPFFIGQLG
jgi:hypothetical protein